MYDSNLQEIPKSTNGCAIILFIIAAPFIGFLIGKGIGLFIGLLISFICLATLFSGHVRRGLTCEICGRSLVNLGRGSPLVESLNIGTIMSTEGMSRGFEGPGDECLRCGRIYCTDCAEMDMTCVCGSRKFRTVRLKYR